MARKYTVYARAARRAASALKELPEGRGRMVAHNGTLHFTCPYCSKTLSSMTNRERHITMRSDDTVHADATPLSQQPHDNMTGEGEGEDVRPAKRLRSSDTGTAGCDTRQRSAGHPSSVELFPDQTAGVKYLGTCGRMGDPKKFEVAELLMTTGLSGNNRR